MDASSPLAAIRPRSLFGQDMFGVENNLPLAHERFGSGLNNFQQRLFPKSKQDYFNLDPIRGSSPTASLAADLSQNFRINETSSSPHFATPRRALFTKNTIQAMETREYITTPPLAPSSSPVPMSDIMDMTPSLPQKEPHVAQIDIESPTPVQSPADEMMLDSPLETRPAVAERPRKLGLRRPSLSRAKGHSTGAVPNRVHSTDNSALSWTFHPGSINRPGTSDSSQSQMSLSECFEGSSPSQERRPQTASSPSNTSARPKPHFGSMSGLNVRNGSPINNHSRRPSASQIRPRKSYRRSLSMFENPGDVIRKKEPTPPPTLPSVADVVEEPSMPRLPHFFPANDNIPRISRETMLEVLDGKFREDFDQTMVIDCRFEYEYDGGHIDGAINYNDKDLLATHLFNSPMEGRILLIFHCEYSACRAPMMASHIRSEDRNANVECYPRLSYPDVYILEGGYSGFFNDHRDRCYPQAYVEMGDTNHIDTCEREMDRLRQNRKGLHRAQTFTYGAGASADDSPTAPGRVASQGAQRASGLRRNILDDFPDYDSPIAAGRTSVGNVRDYDSPDMMIGDSPILGNDRAHTRRMVSF